MPFSDKDIGKNGSDNGLLPASTKPLPELMLAGDYGIHRSAVSQKTHPMWWQKYS